MSEVLSINWDNVLLILRQISKISNYKMYTMFVADTLASHLNLHNSEIKNKNDLFKDKSKNGNSEAGDF